MITVQVNPTAAQLPSVADLADAIRNAHFALRNGPLGWAISHLEKASRIASEVGNPQASELANLACALEPAFETVRIVEMCVLDMSPEH
jgi:hypothetical protein